MLKSKKLQYSKSSLRENFIMGFIGHNRTGKTSIASNIAIEWKKSRPDGIVIAFDPQDRFKNIDVEINGVYMPLMDVEIKLYEQGVWYDKVLQYRNALLILDDFKNLHPSSKSEQGWLKLLSFRNEYNIDIIYITHTPSLILNILTSFTTHYFIFYTLAAQGSFQKKIPHYGICVTAANYVNKYVRMYGKGKYPNFPYIIVDTINEKLTSVNINKDMFIKTIKNQNNNE